MNFAHAVLGRLSRTGVMNAIQSQAETELGRKLSKEEEVLIFTNHPPVVVLEQIETVIDSYFVLFKIKVYIIISVWVWFPQIPPVFVPET